MSSRWFDCTEPPICTSLLEKQGEQGAYISLYPSSGWFKHLEPYRTFSNHITTEIARCVGYCHMSSRNTENLIETSLITSLQR